MFKPDNFYSVGIEYDYDALNCILADWLDGDDDEDRIKSVSDSINDSLVQIDGKIFIGDIVVGRVVTASDR